MEGNGKPVQTAQFFGIPDLKKIFPELTDIKDDILILLFDALIHLFIRNCVEANIGITDIYREHHSPFGGVDYKLVYGGSIIIMQCHFGALIPEVVPQSDTITGIHFSRIASPNFMSTVHDFIKQQDILSIRVVIAEDFNGELSKDAQAFYMGACVSK